MVHLMFIKNLSYPNIVYEKSPIYGYNCLGYIKEKFMIIKYPNFHKNHSDKSMEIIKEKFLSIEILLYILRNNHLKDLLDLRDNSIQKVGIFQLFILG